MVDFGHLPTCVGDFFAEKNIGNTETAAFIRGDLNFKFERRDVFVALTAETFAVAEGFAAVKKVNSGLKSRFQCLRFESFPVKDIDSLFVEELSSGCSVSLLMKNGDELPFFSATYTFKDDIYNLKTCFEDIGKTGTLDKNRIADFISHQKFCPKCGTKLTGIANNFCPNCVDRKSTLKKSLIFLKEYKSYIFLIFVTLGLTLICNLALPYVGTKRLYSDVLSANGDFKNGLAVVILTIVGVKLFSTAVDVINGIITARVASRVVCGLKIHIFKSISKLDLSFFTGRQTGGLMTQINSDADSIYNFLCDGFPYLVLNTAQLVCVTVIMVIMNPLLSLYSFITIPLFFLTYRTILRLFQKLHARAFSKRRSMNSLLGDVLSGMRVVKAFSKEADESERFNIRSVDAANASTETGIKRETVFPFLSFFLRFGVYIVWFLGGLQIMRRQGNMDYGVLAAFLAYMELAYNPVQQLSRVSNWWADAFNALTRLFDISDIASDVPQTENPADIENVAGEIEFNNVSFSYEKGKTTLENVSFKLEAGKTLGVVGHTGAGKSTIANLLIRLYDPSDGAILIDGVDIRRLSSKKLHESVAIVSQETYLFRGTLLENIRYAKPDATDSEVIEAAKAASAHSFIMKLPDAYQTSVGFGKRELSGGERQRISIARAILKNPKILILDEATAAMDTQTECSIQDSLDRITKNRTTLIIAHRLSTLKNADKLIVIDGGKVVEQGTPNELIAKNGSYRKLYDIQNEALKVIGV